MARADGEDDKQQQQASQYRDAVAMPRKKCWRSGRRQGGINPSSAILRDAVFDKAAGRDDGADPRWGGPDNRQAFFNGPQLRLRKVLRRPPAAKPCVIGRVEYEVGPVAPVDNLARKDNLVTNLNTHFDGEIIL